MTMDILYPIFAPYILQYCKPDYDNFVRMMEETLNLYHIQELVDVMESVDYKKLEENTKENKKLFDDLNNNKDIIKELKELGFAFNPETRKIIKLSDELISKAVAENIMSKNDKRDNKECKIVQFPLKSANKDEKIIEKSVNNKEDKEKSKEKPKRGRSTGRRPVKKKKEEEK